MFEHIHAAGLASTEALVEIAQFANAAVTGSLPHIPHFPECRLHDQHKPNRGLRLIIIAETWQRLVSLHTMDRCCGTGPSPAHSSSGGAQSFGDAARTALADWGRVVLLHCSSPT